MTPRWPSASDRSVLLLVGLLGLEACSSSSGSVSHDGAADGAGASDGVGAITDSGGGSREGGGEAAPDGGSASTASAGPDGVLAFPAKDFTLFGRPVEPAGAPFTVRSVRWSMTSGPAPVVFSAAHAFTTTVTFSATGTYVFELAVESSAGQGTDSVTVTVNPASSQTSFYVDPTFAGAGAGSGSEQAPWKTLVDDGNPAFGDQWSQINSALATKPVIIYFSARQAGADAAEELVGSVRVRRTDKSANRLTLDGMSRYNGNDANPSWLDYNGASRMRIRQTRGCCFSIGWYSLPDGDGKFDHVTLRGFEVTGSGARITWGGSDSVLEYVWSHDVTDLGATVQFDAAVTDYPECKDIGKSHAITVRKNVIERGIGEGIYMAGTYTLTTDGGCPSYGNTHSDILIEGNQVSQPGMNGDQGDGIDLKAGLMNVTVRNNIVSNTHPVTDEADGITALGVFPPARTDYLIEGNTIFNAWHGIIVGSQNGTVIRNNLMYGLKRTGVYPAGDDKLPNTNIEIYNNTVFGGGIGLGFTSRVRIRNNLLVGSDTQIGGYNSTAIDSDYNLLVPQGSEFPEGSHSIIQASPTGIVVNASGDFHLVAASPARDKGADLSATGFAGDIEGTARPQGGAWDIGAFEQK